MKDSNISVSVIMLVYNTELYLREALESVINQDLKNIEIICIDDCSTDGSVEILDEYKSKYSNFRLFRNEKNVGILGELKNLGIKHAEGEYIGFVDSDDFISKNYFNSLYTNAKKFDADISLNTNIIKFTQKENITFQASSKRPEVLDTPEKKEEQMVKTGSNCNKIYKRSFIEKHSLQCCTIRSIAEDNPFSFLSVTLANKVVANYDTAYYYRRHANNLTAGRRTKDNFEILTIYENIDKMLLKYISEGIISSKYLAISDKRKEIDFTWFIKLCNEPDLSDFKEQVKIKFPKVADSMGFTVRGSIIIFFTGTLNLAIRILRKIYKITFNKISKQNSQSPYNVSIYSKKYTNAWLFMDREEIADDNAEHLYRYVQKNHPEQKIYFVLKKDTASWKRLEAEGFSLLDYKSFEFQRAIRGCSAIISSHFDLYLYILAYASKHLTRIKHFWLQHGVIKDNLSSWLNDPTLKLDLFLTSSTAEHDSIVSDKSSYVYTSKEVKLLGLPRHDALVPFCKQHGDVILIMPTWRRELQYIQDKEELKQHAYIQRWSSLLQSSKLQELATQHQKRIIFFLHPSAQKYGKLFNLPAHIEIAEQQTHKIQDLFKLASFMITDYSSVAFEMAFLQKAVLYYQFDQESFFEKQWKRGYFSYEEHGFGPVATKEEELLTAMQNMLSSSELPEKYIKNIDTVFPFRDGKNCERVCKTLFDKMNTTS